MKKNYKLGIIISLFLILFNCTNNEKKGFDSSQSAKPEDLYQDGMNKLDNQNYNDAIIIFEDINFKYPLSNEAVQSQIMIGFIEYIKLNYDEAIFKFNKIINRYPSHKNLDYVYYMRALCYFEQIENEYLDGEYNVKALDNFNQVINRFPNSTYAKDSTQKIILVKENIAAKHMDIAIFYLNQKKYLAAMKRYKNVIEDYSQSKFTPEALHRLTEIYYNLGMVEDAKKTAAVIAFNYPDSKWYKYSYNLLNQRITNKNSLINRISNLLKKDDDK
jgi:outer membrane protein assembly factor BamD